LNSLHKAKLTQILWVTDMQTARVHLKE
jgi:hypothetical protein